ncbi:hypothetical protein VC83_09278 [Pseudogymnoascus destructans]|uniref:SnoaL-like domain-containing protein n=2 Tax=Pseudogymnoascus destructans TaxID=655981 RepID=L8FXR5_PSED2|nr:uncharacterized protein VC83_09278 [Pseudogymnoascus destructans]ELR05359.1 hypothetical protein GMDG_07342 [Pseudogymnoascus destructans 20631-21]OAF54432.1 hypothetical protein VC83_09278 [Pseudogymnoascus destructans]
MKLANLLLPLVATAPAVLASRRFDRAPVQIRMYQPAVPAYDDSRVQHFHDKVLLARMKEYFVSFVVGNYTGMHDLQADNFHITDIPLAIVRADREQWLGANRGFSSLMTDVKVQAISIDGSSEPCKFGIMENVVWFTLAVDPPEEAKPGLPPGIKKGDTAGMIMLSTIWWNEEGKVKRDLEYGKLVWPGFDIDAFKTW